MKPMSPNRAIENNTRPPTILCVDDDPNVSASIARSMHDWGVEVLRAYNGMQGFWTVVTTLPDAVVADLSMPNGTGVELIECITRNAKTAPIPVIVLTGDHDDAVREDLRELGVSAVLRKPTSSRRLLWELARHMCLPDTVLREFLLSA